MSEIEVSGSSDGDEEEDTRTIDELRVLLIERESDARVAAEIGKALVEKNAELQATLAQTTALYEELNSAHSLNQQMLHERTAALNASENDKESMLAEIAKLETLYAEAKRQAGDSHSAIEEQRRLREAVERQKDMIQRAEDRAAEARRTASRLQEENQQLSDALFVERARLSDLQQATGAEIDAANEMRRKLSSALRALRRQNLSLESALDENDFSQVIEQLSSQIAQLRREGEETQRLLDHERNRASSLTEKLDELVLQESARSNSQAARVDGECVDISPLFIIEQCSQAFHRAFSQHSDALGERVTAHVEQLSNRLNVLAKSAKICARLTAESNEAAGKMQRLRSENAQLRAELASRTDELRRVQLAREALVQRVQVLERAESAAEAALKQLQRDLDDRAAEVERYIRQLEQSRQETGRARRELRQKLLELERVQLELEQRRSELAQKEEEAKRRALALSGAASEKSALANAMEEKAKLQQDICTRLRSEVQRLKKRIAELDQELFRERAKAERSAAALNRLESAHERLARLLVERDHALSESSARVRSLETLVQELRTELERLRATSAASRSPPSKIETLKKLRNQDGAKVASCGCALCRCGACDQVMPRCVYDSEHDLVCPADDSDASCALQWRGCRQQLQRRSGWISHRPSCAQYTVVCKIMTGAASATGAARQMCSEEILLSEYDAHCLHVHSNVICDPPLSIVSSSAPYQCPLKCGQTLRIGAGLQRHLLYCPLYIVICPMCKEEMQREMAIDHHCRIVDWRPHLLDAAELETEAERRAAALNTQWWRLGLDQPAEAETEVASPAVVVRRRSKQPSSSRSTPSSTRRKKKKSSSTSLRVKSSDDTETESGAELGAEADERDVRTSTVRALVTRLRAELEETRRKLQTYEQAAAAAAAAAAATAALKEKDKLADTQNDDEDLVDIGEFDEDWSASASTAAGSSDERNSSLRAALEAAVSPPSSTQKKKDAADDSTSPSVDRVPEEPTTPDKQPPARDPDELDDIMLVCGDIVATTVRIRPSQSLTDMRAAVAQKVPLSYRFLFLDRSGVDVSREAVTSIALLVGVAEDGSRVVLCEKVEDILSPRLPPTPKLTPGGKRSKSSSRGRYRSQSPEVKSPEVSRKEKYSTTEVRSPSVPADIVLSDEASEVRKERLVASNAVALLDPRTRRSVGNIGKQLEVAAAGQRPNAPPSLPCEKAIFVGGFGALLVSGSGGKTLLKLPGQTSALRINSAMKVIFGRFGTVRQVIVNPRIGCAFVVLDSEAERDKVVNAMSNEPLILGGYRLIVDKVQEPAQADAGSSARSAGGTAAAGDTETEFLRLLRSMRSHVASLESVSNALSLRRPEYALHPEDVPSSRWAKGEDVPIRARQQELELRRAAATGRAPVVLDKISTLLREEDRRLRAALEVAIAREHELRRSAAAAEERAAGGNARVSSVVAYRPPASATANGNNRERGGSTRSSSVRKSSSASTASKAIAYTSSTSSSQHRTSTKANSATLPTSPVRSTRANLALELGHPTALSHSAIMDDESRPRSATDSLSPRPYGSLLSDAVNDTVRAEQKIQTPPKPPLPPSPRSAAVAHTRRRGGLSKKSRETSSSLDLDSLDRIYRKYNRKKRSGNAE